MTQAKLSKVSGVPRSTIAHAESGNSNPSLMAIAKIAKSLNVSIEELIAKPKGRYNLVRSKDVPLELRSGGKCKIFKMLPDPIKGMEIDKFELAPGSRMKGVPHIDFTKEYLICIRGQISVYSDGETFELKKGDVLAFPGDKPHSYHNTGASICVCVSVVVLVV